MNLASLFSHLNPKKWLGKSIASKLYSLLLLVGLLPMAVVAYSMYQSAYQGIEKQSFSQLESVKTIKAKQVTDYFQLIRDQMLTFAENRMIVEAMKAFPAAQKSAREESNVTAEDLAKMRAETLAYYNKQFSAEYHKRTEHNAPPSAKHFDAIDDDSIYLQYQYISSNPNPLGQKEALDAAADSTEFSRLHAKYHPVIRSYLQKFGFYDIFLCDLESGDIVYSVFKELDFSTSLITGPYRNTNFARAFRMAAAAESRDEFYLVDYENYTPSYEDAACFVAAPVFDGNTKIGVALFQVPINRISSIMNERTGLGKTGETYAVGSDGLYRNDSRFLDELQTRTTILNPQFKVDTVGTRSAFQGASDTRIIRDYRNVPVLSSWAPITIYEGIPGKSQPIQWALLSEIDHAEIKAPLGFFTIARTGLFWILIATTVGAITIYFVAGRITKQANSIKEMLSLVGIGVFDARAKHITQDELGDVALALNAMCDNTLNLIQSDDERQQIQDSIQCLVNEMEQIAAGNLAVNLDIRDDITGAISGSVQSMTEQLRSIIRRVQNATYLVTSSADEIVAESTKLSEETDAQSIRIELTSELVLAITKEFEQVSNQSEGSAVVAQKARETANRGYQAVSDTVEGMERIRDQVHATSKRIKRLGESSQEIGEIVQLISDIADRTSILALNASIQAAMAGEAGHGFAVVAEEVERLAERSNDATKQISTLIKSIQAETSEAISDMEEATREVVEGTQLATQAGQTLEEITEVSTALESLIQTVSQAAIQQSNAAKEVAATMTQISASTKQAAEKARSSTESVASLSMYANQLGDSVSMFRLDSDCDSGEALVTEIEAVSKMAHAKREPAKLTVGV
ncbi:MAG: methyl-accepting chemotaxis protein [Pirellulaceae bacterium]|nr:methyl-accepting chemotaxis protein [Pirellulaceae bacterium]